MKRGTHIFQQRDAKKGDRFYCCSLAGFFIFLPSSLFADIFVHLICYLFCKLKCNWFYFSHYSCLCVSDVLSVRSGPQVHHLRLLWPHKGWVPIPSSTISQVPPQTNFPHFVLSVYPQNKTNSLLVNCTFHWSRLWLICLSVQGQCIKVKGTGQMRVLSFLHFLLSAKYYLVITHHPSSRSSPVENKWIEMMLKLLMCHVSDQLSFLKKITKWSYLKKLYNVTDSAQIYCGCKKVKCFCQGTGF